MAYIIPNATDTGSSQRYANINQAEPDSVDIEALGNRANWVRSGCAVSILVGNQFSVAAGTVIVNNTPYPVSATTSGIAIPAATVGARTDLIVARLNVGGTAVAITRIPGVDSATNPVFPKSKSVQVETNNYDPDKDVLLAAIYVTSAEPDSSNLVDKRLINAAPVTRTSTTAPASSSVDVIGDVVVTSAGVIYVKTGVSTWEAVATRAYADTAGFPIGSVFAWSGQDGSTPGATYLECLGQSVSKTTYSTLWNVIGTLYGPATATEFTLPNLSDGRTIIGTSTIAEYGTAAGSNQTTLTSVHIPEHTHGVSVQKHATLSHTGASVVPGTTANNGGNHAHTTVVHSHTGALMYRAYGDHNDHHVVQATSHGVNAFHVDVVNVNEDDPYDPYNILDEAWDPTEQTNLSRFRAGSNPNTGSQGAHIHPLNIPSHPEMQHIVTENAYGSPVGSITPVPTVPKHIKMRWFIRAI